MDPRTELMQILAAQKSAIEHAEPPKAYIYASANDYSLLRDAIKDFLIQVDTIVSSTELKELAFELTTGTTAPPSIIAPLQDMRSKLERLACSGKPLAGIARPQPTLRRYWNMFPDWSH